MKKDNDEGGERQPRRSVRLAKQSLGLSVSPITHKKMHENLDESAANGMMTKSRKSKS